MLSWHWWQHWWCQDTGVSQVQGQPQQRSLPNIHNKDDKWATFFVPSIATHQNPTNPKSNPSSYLSNIHCNALFLCSLSSICVGPKVVTSACVCVCELYISVCAWNNLTASPPVTSTCIRGTITNKPRPRERQKIWQRLSSAETVNSFLWSNFNFLLDRQFILILLHTLGTLYFVLEMTVE